MKSINNWWNEKNRVFVRDFIIAGTTSRESVKCIFFALETFDWSPSRWTPKPSVGLKHDREQLKLVFFFFTFLSLDARTNSLWNRSEKTKTLKIQLAFWAIWPRSMKIMLHFSGRPKCYVKPDMILALCVKSFFSQCAVRIMLNGK